MIVRLDGETNGKAQKEALLEKEQEKLKLMLDKSHRESECVVITQLLNPSLVYPCPIHN